jgi:hypothetical protein
MLGRCSRPSVAPAPVAGRVSTGASGGYPDRVTSPSAGVGQAVCFAGSRGPLLWLGLASTPAAPSGSSVTSSLKGCPDRVTSLGRLSRTLSPLLGVHQPPPRAPFGVTPAAARHQAGVEQLSTSAATAAYLVGPLRDDQSSRALGKVGPACTRFTGATHLHWRFGAEGDLGRL